jgi:putative phosphoribosyl transferase
MKRITSVRSQEIRIPSDTVELEGTLAIPDGAQGIVLFAHGSGSSRLSPRNRYVAEALQAAGIGTLLFDLLSEEEAENRENVFDVDFLAHRLADATRDVRARRGAQKYAIGYFGASTGAAAALIAAAQDSSIRAVVSRGGRPDLALHCLDRVKAPTLLIVGGDDVPVIAMNRKAYERLTCEKSLKIVPGATHLFEEPGTLEQVVEYARQWFQRHLAAEESREHIEPDLPLQDPLLDELMGGGYRNREEAGRELAGALLKYKQEKPVILAIPRGGVPVGFEVAKALDAPLDVIVVRKLGAPDEPELGIGAVVDGDNPQGILNERIISELGVSQEYLEQEVERQLKEIRRRQKAYRGGRPRVDVKGRAAIVIDDGIATGSSVRAALRGIRRAGPKKLVLAVPVAPAETIDAMREEADEIVCLMMPYPFYAVGQFYRDFHQVTDDEVTKLLDVARGERPAARAEQGPLA